MGSIDSALERISMQTASYGDIESAEGIIKDWFQFLGGQPSEVILIENGTPLESQKAFQEGVKAGWLTKFLSVSPSARDIGKHQAYVGDVCCLALSNRDVALRYSTDVLTHRKGHDDWLPDAMRALEEPEVFGFTGSFNAPSKFEDLDTEHYLSKKVSCNFALLPRRRLQEAWHLAAPAFVRSGFRDRRGLDQESIRFLEEIGLQLVLASGDWTARVRKETEDFRVFHTNVHDDVLVQARKSFFRAEGLHPFLNRGDAFMTADNELENRYFGQSAPIPLSAMKRLRIAVGASAIGPVYRKLLGRNDVVEAPELLCAPRKEDALELGQTALIVLVDDPSALARDLPSLIRGKAGRPLQVVVLSPAAREFSDEAWQVHETGAIDRLLLSRDFSGDAPIDADLLAQNGVFAIAHSPTYLIVRSSSLGRLEQWLDDNTLDLRGESAFGGLSEKDVIRGRREDWMKEAERQQGSEALCAALGTLAEFRSGPPPRNFQLNNAAQAHSPATAQL